MMEVFTKKFWQDVKKTFDEAKAETPVHENGPLTPAEDSRKAIATSEVPPPADSAPLA